MGGKPGVRFKEPPGAMPTAGMGSPARICCCPPTLAAPSIPLPFKKCHHQGKPGLVKICSSSSLSTTLHPASQPAIPPSLPANPTPFGGYPPRCLHFPPLPRSSRGFSSGTRTPGQQVAPQRRRRVPLSPREPQRGRRGVGLAWWGKRNTTTVSTTARPRGCVPGIRNPVVARTQPRGGSWWHKGWLWK